MLRRNNKKRSGRRELNLLTVRPKRLREFERNDRGMAVILVPRFGDNRLGRWLMKRVKHPYHRLTLDEVGTFAWDRFDGRTPVKEIASEMEDKFGEKVQPVYDRLGLFLNQLSRARIISLEGGE